MKGKATKGLEATVRAAAEATVKGMKEGNVDLQGQSSRVDVEVLKARRDHTAQLPSGSKASK